MKPTILLLSALLATLLPSFAEVAVDGNAFGQSLGGWTKRDKAVAEYPLSGAVYRTYKPEISPTPDGGLFISVRIDHVRGWLASDDHANLEITVNAKGAIASAQSSIAIQGRSIKSDMILGGNEAGKAILSAEGAVRIGTDLVADLSAKLLRENIVEAGRVSFPAVLRHNYNRLFQAIRVDGVQVRPLLTTPPPSVTSVPAAAPPAAVENALKAEPVEITPPKDALAPGSLPLEIKPYS
jgi:hypothetical protein